ncbi:MAG TPA: hypothetical protein VFL85_02965 [Candidatus Saccharimonadales bacterium]|nr:hypothetical protein [Candidatus Saccharimonadales bacterium]
MSRTHDRTPDEGQQPFDELNDEVVAVLAPARAKILQAEADKVPYTRIHGAFGGAVKRRIELTNSAEKYAATNDADIALLTPNTIRQELFRRGGDQSYGGVLLTPAEFSALTFSPRTLARRVGSQVLAGTFDRPASERQARRKEVVLQSLETNKAKASGVLVTLRDDAQALSRLAAEARAPGYAHMRGEEMDGLMQHAETVFVSMFEAITTNHGAGTDRVESLKAALDYRLSADSYKETFGFWRDMITLGVEWTRAKGSRFAHVCNALDEEIAVQS